MQKEETLIWPRLATDGSGASLTSINRFSPQSRTAAFEQENQIFETAEKWARKGWELDEQENKRWSLRRQPLVRRTLVATSLPGPRVSVTSGKHVSPRAQGALIAVGRLDGGRFTSRDAVLLEALAEQAALAIENWNYSELLRKRVAVVDEELHDTYRLLSEQSAKLFAAIESIDAALVISDQNGVAVFVNPASGSILRGATPILGEPVARALSAGDLPDLAALDEAEHGSDHAERVRLETTRGNEILSAQFTSLVSHDRKTLGAMLVVTNVSAQRELDRMKTDFVGFVAHELRTPLTTILGYASLMDKMAGNMDPDAMRDMVNIIERHIRRMNRLISDLLDISRLEAGQPLPIRKAEFDLTALCERLVSETRSQLNPGTNLTLTCRSEPDPLLITADAERLEQLVANLLSNAVKYSPDGGQITVGLARVADRVRLQVSDTGMGMTAEQLSHLFQKFYRSPDAKERGIKGTGLGLHLVKILVEAHGGEIQVESTPGRGTVFRVILPVA
jgi:signal transduction histidine kinase